MLYFDTHGTALERGVHNASLQWRFVELVWCAQVIKESAARIAGSAEASPSNSPEAEGNKAALVKELADVKKRFLAVAKKKQAEFAKRVRRPLFHLLPSNAPLISQVSTSL